MDPSTLEARVVVCATGHDGPMGATGVKRLQRLGLIETIPGGMGALDMNSAEDSVVKHTREVGFGAADPTTLGNVMLSDEMFDPLLYTAHVGLIETVPERVQRSNIPVRWVFVVEVGFLEVGCLEVGFFNGGW